VQEWSTYALRATVDMLRLVKSEGWWPRRELNPRHHDFQSPRLNPRHPRNRRIRQCLHQIRSFRSWLPLAEMRYPRTLIGTILGTESEEELPLPSEADSVSAAATAVSALVELTDAVRKRVNRRRTHAALFADRQRFTRACSAMDMLGDTCQALHAYLGNCERGADTPTSYLIVFGALQVLYVQQDAAFWLCAALGYPQAVTSFPGPEKWVHSTGNEELSRVRNLRASSVGHPVRRDKGPREDRGSYFIVQHSLRATGFQMMAHDEAGDTRWISVPVLEFVKTQATALGTTLRATLREVDLADRAHREKFAGQPMEGIFRGLSHPIEKMHQAVSEPSFRPVGMFGVDAVRRAMAQFRQGLEQRHEPFGDDLEFQFGHLEAGLTRLTDFFEGRTDDAELADILATYVADRVAELRSWAEEMDREYGA